MKAVERARKRNAVVEDRLFHKLKLDTCSNLLLFYIPWTFIIMLLNKQLVLPLAYSLTSVLYGFIFFFFFIFF